MNATARREAILQKLARSSEPVSASALAAQLGVSRQIVVGDVALLRAGGAAIDATPRGYLLRGAAAGLDVIVENALYGEIRANLNVASRYDADAFVRQAESSPASLLSRMTGGVHLHTIRCADEAAFRRIEAALAEAGVLYQKE